MRKTCGTVLIALGLVMLLLAAAMVGSHLWSQKQAGEKAETAMEELTNVLSSGEETPSASKIPDYVLNPEMGMPEKQIDGVAYIGMLEIPALELRLPVISSTSRESLQIAPCRFTGSAYLDNLVIGAHNYPAHFGRLAELSYGDLVIFTDMDENIFEYQVADIEILQPDQADVLSAGEWPLSLYTCTVGGRTRVTLRCDYSWKQTNAN